MRKLALRQRKDSRDGGIMSANIQDTHEYTFRPRHDARL